MHSSNGDDSPSSLHEEECRAEDRHQGKELSGRNRAKYRPPQRPTVARPLRWSGKPSTVGCRALLAIVATSQNPCTLVLLLAPCAAPWPPAEEALAARDCRPKWVGQMQPMTCQSSHRLASPAPTVQPPWNPPEYRRIAQQRRCLRRRATVARFRVDAEFGGWYPGIAMPRCTGEGAESCAISSAATFLEAPP